MSSLSFSSNTNTECTYQPYENCAFTQNNRPSSSATFTSCNFTFLTSTLCGAAIAFTSASTLTVSKCIFTNCSTTVSCSNSTGGAAIFLRKGTLSVRRSMFVNCTSKSYGGAIHASGSCTSSSVSFSSFLFCKADHGSAITTFVGPSSTAISNRYISCVALSFGGAIFHDGNQPDFLSLSDSLFVDNHANCRTNRGGGGIEDYRRDTYTSKYSFCFFTRNSAPNGVGNDISTHTKSQSINNIKYCFTTTVVNSFWNLTKHADNWFPSTNMNIEPGQLSSNHIIKSI